MTQHYLVSVSRMSTSDEADCVSKWSAVVAEENLDNITLSKAARLTEINMDKCPLTNVRPMTEDEIAEWRDAERENN